MRNNKAGLNDALEQPALHSLLPNVTQARVSLALHYVSGTAFGVLVGRIATWLGRGGRIVASMEHPIVTAPRHRTGTDIALIDDYADEGPRSTSWFIDGVVKYHRTIERLGEPMPAHELLRHRPDLELHRHRPPLLVVRAQRR